MSRYKCPVCEIEIEAGMICPNCAFETHYIMPDSKIIAEIENDRAIKHRNWWNAQQQKVAKLNDVITAKEREIIAKQEECEKLVNEMINLRRKKPAAFLVTEQKTVYCLYEGVNTFGSAKTNPSCEQHQKIIIPGVMVLPIYFSIDVQAIDVEDLDKGYHCTICELPTEAPTLYINTTTNPVGKGLPIMDGDEIVVAISGSDCKIKFRTNIN